MNEIDEYFLIKISEKNIIDRIGKHSSDII